MRPYQFRQPFEEPAKDGRRRDGLLGGIGGGRRQVEPKGPVLRTVRQHAASRAAALLVGVSGALNLLSLLATPARSYWMRFLFPLEFAGSPLTLTLTLGAGLALAGACLWIDKRRSWQLAVFFGAATAILHLLPLVVK